MNEIVNVEGSYTLSSLKNMIGEVQDSMQSNLNLLNNAFAVACENWKDKNAATCDKALADHNAAMRSAFGRLEDFETALSRLVEILSSYEDI